MRHGIQTGAWQPLDVLQQLYAWNYRMIRLDYDPSPAHAAEVILDARLVGFAVLFLVKDTAQIAALGRLIEPRPDLPPVIISSPNEPDLGHRGHLSTRSCRAWIERAAPLCQAAGFDLVAPAIANLNDRGFTYLKEIWKTLAGLPAVGVDVHRYAPVTSALDPQPGSRTRADEIRRLKDIIGTRHWGVSEFGYASRPLTEAQQAHEWATEFVFWDATDAQYAIAYQLNRSAVDQYGVREGTRWLPAASVLATSDIPNGHPVPLPIRVVTPTALADTIVNFRYGAIDQGFETRPVSAQGSDETVGLVTQPDGTLAILSPNGTQWLSIQPDGSREPRDAHGEPGAWETFTRQGNVVTERAKDNLARPLVQFLLKDPTAASPAPVPLGPLSVQGVDFLEHGRRYLPIEVTNFMQFYRFTLGQDLTPTLYPGFTLDRTTLTMKWIPEQLGLPPLHLPIPDLQRLLGDYLTWKRNIGRRSELTVLCDMRDLGIAREEYVRILSAVYEVAQDFTDLCLVEDGNEVLDGENQLDLPYIMAHVDRHGVIYSTGSGTSGSPVPAPYGVYCTPHLNRGPLSKQLADVNFGEQVYGSWAEHPIPTMRPMLTNETQGAGEVPSDSRYTDPHIARELARGMRARNGGCFHCTSGVYSQPLGPTQELCRQAFLEGSA